MYTLNWCQEFIKFHADVQHAVLQRTAHTSKILRLSLDLPIVVEIVDTPENIKAFLACIETVVTEGLVTLEKAVIQYITSILEHGE